MSEIINYNSLVNNLSTDIKDTKGKGIKIAILDTGCYKHKSLNNSIIQTYDAINDSTSFSSIKDNSLSAHGTFIAGLIAASGANSEVNGIASGAELIIIKVAENDNSVFSDNVLTGLKWLANKCPVKPDLINISLDFFYGNNKPEFQTLFSNFYNNNIYCFAAAQNDDSLQNDLFYPAKEENVLAVGALSDPGISKINPKVSYLVPNIEYKSCNNSSILQYKNNSGCSFATAITTATMALTKSYQLNNNLSVGFKDFFDQQLKTFKIDIFNNKLEIFKL